MSDRVGFAMHAGEVLLCAQRAVTREAGRVVWVVALESRGGEVVRYHTVRVTEYGEVMAAHYTPNELHWQTPVEATTGVPATRVPSENEQNR